MEGEGVMKHLQKSLAEKIRSRFLQEAVTKDGLTHPFGSATISVLFVSVDSFEA